MVLFATAVFQFVCLPAIVTIGLNINNAVGSSCLVNKRSCENPNLRFRFHGIGNLFLKMARAHLNILSSMTQRYSVRTSSEQSMEI
jgi:hypothetical protein